MDDDSKKYTDGEIAKIVAFPYKKIGDTPTDAIQLTPKKYVDGIASALSASITGLISSVSSVSFNFFGDGSDGPVAVSSGSTLLARDMYYTTLNVSSTATIRTNNYRIYVKNILTLSGSGTISNNGFAGGAPGSVAGGIGGTGGGGGSIIAAGSFSSTLGGFNGSNGGAGGGIGGSGSDGSPGIQGSAFGVLTQSIGTAGIDATGRHSGLGGSSGSPVKAGGASATGGGPGNITAPTTNPRSFINNYQTFDTLPILANYNGSGRSGGSGGGGGGGGTAGAPSNPVCGGGGGGGGTGGTGGFVAVYANAIINTVTGGLQSKGGNGANGGAGGNSTTGGTGSAGGGGGGMGGSGGTGGIILTVYKTLINTGSFDVSGGTAGSGGSGGTQVNGGADGDPGLAGFTGNPGSIWQYQV